MPVWSVPELIEKISEEEIIGVSVDTSIFDQSECNLKYKLFDSLKQFRDTRVSLLISDVVRGEIIAHIAERISEAKEKMRAAVNQYGKAMHSGDAAEAFANLDNKMEPIEAATAQFSEFEQATGLEVLISQETVNITEILNAYFSMKPPFSTKPDKKSEFPDALALGALEGWAANRKGCVVLVSRDSGWQKFAESSDWLVCFNDLRTVLGAFNSEDTFFAKRLVVEMNNGVHGDILAAVDAHLENAILDMYPNIEAESAFQYDVDFDGWDFQSRESFDADRVSAVESDEDSITLSLVANVVVAAEASFTFVVRDEGDYIPVGGAQHSIEQTIRLPLSITVTRDPEAPKLLDAEVSEPRGLTLDFGYVEIDHGDYDDEDYEPASIDPQEEAVRLGAEEF